MTVRDLEVLDLSDDAVRDGLGLRPGDLDGDDYDQTQAVAQAAAKAGFGGILAPSAALPGRRTLVVFAAGMGHVAPGPSRVRQPPPRLADLLRAVRPHPQVPSAIRDSLRSLGESGSQAVRRWRRRRR